VEHETILILGGYGNTGLCLARLLLQETDAGILLAGRTGERAAAQLNTLFKGNRASGTCADASNRESISRALKGVDFLIVASSTAKHAGEVAAASLDAGIDYLDIHYSQQKVEVLRSMAGEIEAAGRCFITEAGFHPGLPAAMVRYVAEAFTRMDRAIVGSVINQVIPMTDALYELVEELRGYQAELFKDGRWQKVGWTSSRKINFGQRFGSRSCFPMMLEEMRAVPKLCPSVKETGFYIAGFNWFVDWIVFPLGMVALSVWPERAVKPVGKLIHWGMKRFSSPPFGLVMKVVASGEKDGQPKSVELSVYHEDGYMFTAIPVVACMLQYLDGSIARPGLWMMGHLIDPQRLVKDMERMGVEVRCVSRPEEEWGASAP
jgi:saccharopine dehydrogenase-like NADP-dependent oxidoreductase